MVNGFQHGLKIEVSELPKYIHTFSSAARLAAVCSGKPIGCPCKKQSTSTYCCHFHLASCARMFYRDVTWHGITFQFCQLYETLANHPPKLMGTYHNPQVAMILEEYDDHNQHPFGGCGVFNFICVSIVTFHTWEGCLIQLLF